MVCHIKISKIVKGTPLNILANKKSYPEDKNRYENHLKFVDNVRVKLTLRGLNVKNCVTGLISFLGA